MQTSSPRNYREGRTLVVIYLAIFGCCLGSVFLGWGAFNNLARSMGRNLLCSGTYTIKTWIDGNSNGTRDAGEAPLPGVKVVAVYDAITPTEVWGSDETDQDGLAELSGTWNQKDIDYYGDSLRFSTGIPPGYTLTTPKSYSAQLCKHRTFSFGFIAESETESEP